MEVSSILDTVDATGLSMKRAEKFDLTDDCHHYTNRSQVPLYIQSYFDKRHVIFSLYDRGIFMTDDAWYGVTPEPVACQIASEMAKFKEEPKTVIIDAFGGAGGNVIAFALSGHWKQVIGIERDAATLACAQRNADIYGVDPSAILWVHGDSFEYFDKLLNRPHELHPCLRVEISSAMVFASPPWGGPSYAKGEVFDLDAMRPYDIGQLYAAYKQMDHFLFLPWTSNIGQIKKVAGRRQRIEVMRYHMAGGSKAAGVFIPRTKSAVSP